MSDIATNEKRRRQNRESQRRYRKRQKWKPKDYVFDGLPSYHPMLPLDQQNWITPNPSTNMPWIDVPHVVGKDAGLQRNRLLEREADLLRNPNEMSEQCYEGSETTMINDQMYSCAYEISPLPATAPLPIHARAPTTEHATMNPGLTFQPSKELEAQPQHVPSSMSKYVPTTGSISSPFSAEEYNSEQNSWTTPPPPIRTRKPSRDKGSGDSKYQHLQPFHYQPGQRQHNAPHHHQPEKPPLSKPAMPRVGSRAVEMITRVEKLYKFGVNIGILPEDKEMQLSLRRMKRRFISLLPQPYISESDSSEDEHSEGDSDDSEFL